MSLPTISVVIITRDRPAAMLRQTLGALDRQTVAPLETLVVDTSSGDALPKMIAAEFPSVRVLHIPDGPRCMPWSRNRGIASTTGAVIAFLDDDALAEPQWLAELARAYGEDAGIGGVGGRVIEGLNLSGTAAVGGDAVAWLDAVGVPQANFNSTTEGCVEVAHLKGCNMSFRRTALAAIGGFDEFYTQIANREESDVCVRVRNAGFRLLFNPDAAVDHKGFSLFAHKRVQLENVNSGFQTARNDGYYIAKNFGAHRWLAWFLHSNVRSLARAFKITYMVFARLPLNMAGGVAGQIAAGRIRQGEPPTKMASGPQPKDTSRFPKMDSDSI